MPNPTNSYFGNQILSDVPFYIPYADGCYLTNTMYNADGTYFNFTGSEVKIIFYTKNGTLVFSSEDATSYITLLGAVIDNLSIAIPQSIIAANFDLGDSCKYSIQLIDSLSKPWTLFTGIAYIQ